MWVMMGGEYFSLYTLLCCSRVFFQEMYYQFRKLESWEVWLVGWFLRLQWADSVLFVLRCVIQTARLFGGLLMEIHLGN